MRITIQTNLVDRSRLSGTGGCSWPRTHGIILGLLFLCLESSGCSKATEQDTAAATPTYEVVITAHHDGDQTVTGVEILQGTLVTGTTDHGGILRLFLRGTEGETVALTVKCPAGFASPEKPILVGLRHLTPGSPPPSFEAECSPLLHSLVVGLRATHGAGLPVVRLGQTVAKTDDWGVAHLMLEATPNEQVALTLDTSNDRSLRPQSPTLTFVAPDRDELVLLEQKFTVKRTAVQTPKKAIPRRL